MTRTALLQGMTAKAWVVLLNGVFHSSLFQYSHVGCGAVPARDFSPFPLSTAPEEEGTLNANEVTITHSPMVLEQLEELRLARESGAATAADLGQAQSVLSDLTAQRGRLEGQLRPVKRSSRRRARCQKGRFPKSTISRTLIVGFE
jgi:hypothetical protein